MLTLFSFINWKLNDIKIIRSSTSDVISFINPETNEPIDKLIEGNEFILKISTDNNNNRKVEYAFTAGSDQTPIFQGTSSIDINEENTVKATLMAPGADMKFIHVRISTKSSDSVNGVDHDGARTLRTTDSAETSETMKKELPKITPKISEMSFTSPSDNGALDKLREGDNFVLNINTKSAKAIGKVEYAFTAGSDQNPDFQETDSTINRGIEIIKVTLKAPGDDMKFIHVRISTKSSDNENGEVSESKLWPLSSPDIESPSESLDNNTFNQGDSISITVKFNYFEDRDGQFEYRFYQDTKFEKLSSDNVKEITSENSGGEAISSKMLLAYESKTYRLTIPPPALDNTNESQKFNLQIRVAVSDLQPASNIISKEITILKPKSRSPSVAPTTTGTGGLTSSEVAGIVFAVLLGLVIIALVVYFVFCKKPANDRSSSDMNEGSGSGVYV